MSALVIVLSIVDIILAVAMIALFLIQEGNDQGMGVVGGGSSDSFYSKAKGRTLEEKLKRFTLYCVVGFAVISIVLYLAISRGW